MCPAGAQQVFDQQVLACELLVVGEVVDALPVVQVQLVQLVVDPPAAAGRVTGQSLQMASAAHPAGPPTVRDGVRQVHTNKILPGTGGVLLTSQAALAAGCCWHAWHTVQRAIVALTPCLPN